MSAIAYIEIKRMPGISNEQRMITCITKQCRVHKRITNIWDEKQQETSFKKIIVEGEYMWKNLFCVRTQSNLVQVWNNLKGENCWRKVKKHDKN